MLQRPDRRQVAWEDVGEPDAATIVYGHGTPGSCLQRSVFIGNDLIRRCGVRVITPIVPAAADRVFNRFEPSTNGRRTFKATRRPFLTSATLRVIDLVARFAPRALAGIGRRMLAPADRAVVAGPEMTQRFVAMLREALRQGPRGTLVDLQLAARDWEIRADARLSNAAAGVHAMAKQRPARRWGGIRARCQKPSRAPSGEAEPRADPSQGRRCAWPSVTTMLSVRRWLEANA